MVIATWGVTEGGILRQRPAIKATQDTKFSYFEAKGYKSFFKKIMQYHEPSMKPLERTKIDSVAFSCLQVPLYGETLATKNVVLLCLPNRWQHNTTNKITSLVGSLKAEESLPSEFIAYCHRKRQIFSVWDAFPHRC